MPHILVIDDSSVLLEASANALRASGYHVRTASNLAELDHALSEHAYDLVLVDVKMPEMFGDDVVEFLRSERKLRCKLALYSDSPESELASRAQAAGADGYVSKAGGEGSLLEGVRALLGEVPPAPAPTESPKKGRILIVDDSETTTLLLEQELKLKGFEVHTADTADKATKIILKKKTRPDLVLLDVRMPGVNGEQFCRFIKSNSLFAGIKVLLCSAEEPEELKRICREAGADGFVAKDAILAKVLAGDLGVGYPLTRWIVAVPSRTSGASGVAPKGGVQNVDVSRTVTEPEIRIEISDSFEPGTPSSSSISPFSSQSLPRARPWVEGTLGLHTIGDEYSRSVRELQKALVKTGYLQRANMPDDVNDWGAYFKNTFDAVAMFQADMGLSPPKRGYADPDTQGVLRAQAMAVDVAASRRWRG